jgi:hypothetical protein
VTPIDSDQRDDSKGRRHGDWKERAAAYFAGTMPPDERAAFEREMAADPDLTRAVYTEMGMGPVFHEAMQALRIRNLESHARLTDGSVTKRVPWWGRTRSRFALTAIAAAVVILVVLVSKLGEPPRAPAPAGRTSTASFRGISPSGEIDALPTQFLWTAHPAAAHYRLEIYDDSSGRVFETITSYTSLIVAMDRLAERGLRAGYWRVVPLDRHGSELDPSDDLHFTISMP